MDTQLIDTAQHNDLYRIGNFRAHATISNSYTASLHSAAAGGNQLHNNMPPYLVISYIIKN